ncbi:CoA binding domain-containing protein [Trichoderma chlorosporum]
MAAVTEATAKRFFSSPFFAVVGASSNPAKFGHKVHAWYLNHDLSVTPINPASKTVTVNDEDYPTVPDVKSLPKPAETSVSIITPPGITINVLKEAKSVGIPAVWLQPGTFDKDVLDFALADGAFEAVVYGEGGRGSEGWCVLVDGGKALQDAGKL